MAEKKNYWEMQKSFWKTPIGIVTWILLLAAFLGGGLLALNVFGSTYPVIESFHADPVVVTPGGASNLSWSVIGASRVEIDQGVGEVGLKGFAEVRPSQTTTYRLTAINGTINRSMTLKIMVGLP
ncbi:MAG: hypothetical protein JW999_10780 [Methanotrichaceae archaeon]|nr:hypothetical protein [Methanotrichaceae archaeon]